MALQHPIPAEFANDVRFVDSKDDRSDQEILDSLTKYVPISEDHPEKNIWSFWHAGVLSMPEWCQRNIINWVRLCGPTWTLRVLDNVPSSLNNALKWTGSSEVKLPDTFVKGTMDGPYTGPHSADFLRGAALYLHGGVWMDVGCLLVRDLDRICWNQLGDPNSPFQVSVPWMYGTIMANHFVASRKGDPFIKHWHDIFIHMWEGQTNSSRIIEHPLAAIGQDIKFEDSVARGFGWEFKVEPQFVAGYVGQVLAWMRLSMLEEPNGFNGREYWSNNVLLFDALTEAWGAEEVVGFQGEDLFNILATKRDADPESAEYKMAHKTIWKLLTSSSLQKITHGKGLTKTDALGILLEKEENAEIDVRPGTFFELLRYGSVHFEQIRDAIDYKKAPKPEKAIQKGLLEA